MARPREFDTAKLLQQAGELFVTRGYNATSIDEIVKATGVVRGSLYSIFGSKRGLFVAVLEQAAEWRGASGSEGTAAASAQTEAGREVLLDLLNVAILEIASHDSETARLVQQIIDSQGIAAGMLGKRALERAGLSEATSRSENSHEGGNRVS